MLIALRWVHFVAGITWVGLLYFFNLVNIPFQRELDAKTKLTVVPNLMPKALWWFRWSSVVTVLAGIAYWMHIVGSDVQERHCRRSASVEWRADRRILCDLDGGFRDRDGSTDVAGRGLEEWAGTGRNHGGRAAGRGVRCS